METLIVLGIIGLVGYSIYKAGKREGSRKGIRGRPIPRPVAPVAV